MQTESLQKTKAHNTEGKCRNQRVLCNTDRHGGKKVHKNSRPFKKTLSVHSIQLLSLGICKISDIKNIIWGIQRLLSFKGDTKVKPGKSI